MLVPASEISTEDYEGLVRKLIRFLEGDTDDVVKELNARILEASSATEFELAARLRDRLSSVERAMENAKLRAPETKISM